MPKGLVVGDLWLVRGRLRAGPIDFAVEPGAELWLVGPNGAGKSTLLGVIAGLLPAARGNVELNGHRLVGGGAECPAWKRDVALLLQDLGLWPHLSVGRQAMWVAREAARHSGERGEPIAERVTRLADELGVTHLLTRKPPALSGGEAQRCALLRTLASQRSLILLDEPMAAQHAEGRGRIEHVLAEERGRGAITVIAGHQPGSGARVVDLGIAGNRD
ncbi:MAG: ATP-binding cassette domain-containing protein [Planctomycetota bacterium]